MTLERITAPYGFVPLSDKIVFPSWLQPRTAAIGEAPQVPPLHDMPFRDGICGTLELEVHAETPIFVRGASSDPSQPFQLPDGTYALPGTALRGALRNVVEIATFGRFGRVNHNHRYAVRDLHNRHLYGQFMAALILDPKTRKSEPMPLVNAGMLWQKKQDDGTMKRWIEICDFGKIEYGRAMEIARKQGLVNYQPGRKQSSVDKYKTWRGKNLDFKVRLDSRRPPTVGNRRMLSRYGVALPDASGRGGRLVFTGQPSNWDPQAPKRTGAGNPKHHDFVFLPTDQRLKLEVTKQHFDDFEFAHSDRGQQNNLGKSQTPNQEWGYWQTKMEKGEPVPVFFLTDDQATRLKAFGLAMMFRLPYQFSIGQAIEHANPDHVRPGARLDFADGLFGTVHQLEEGERRAGVLALKGRVGISHAKAIGRVQPGAPIQTVLGAPKASYYPNYVEQDPTSPGSPPPNGQYMTWNDSNCRPRGWKRYRPVTTWQQPAASNAEGLKQNLDNVGTTLRPLPAGTVFRAHVDLHNLRPMEVGALLWALALGGDPNRHTLGLGRPLGFGKVRMAVGSHALQAADGQAVDLNMCRKAFEDYMEDQVKDWSNTPQIKELLALARPTPPDNLRYQRLSPNEFTEAKKLGLALPSAAEPPRRVVVASGNLAGRAPAAGRPAQGGQHFGASRSGQRGPSIAKPAGPGPAKKPGDLIEVELRDLSKKGKWTCTAPEIPGSKGTIQGDPSSDAATGQRHQVKVIQPITVITNMILEWPK